MKEHLKLTAVFSALPSDVRMSPTLCGFSAGWPRPPWGDAAAAATVRSSKKANGETIVLLDVHFTPFLWIPDHMTD